MSDQSSHAIVLNATARTQKLEKQAFDWTQAQVLSSRVIQANPQLSPAGPQKAL